MLGEVTMGRSGPINVYGVGGFQVLVRGSLLPFLATLAFFPLYMTLAEVLAVTPCVRDARAALDLARFVDQSISNIVPTQSPQT